MERLFLGIAQEKITPEVGGQLYGYRPDIFSKSVEDDLTATAFYFQQGNRKALMLSVTVCLVSTELAQDILSLIEKRFGIPKECCMLSATHTHSGPNTAGFEGWGSIDQKYCEEIFVPAILSAVEKATAKPVPVKMGVARGNSLIGINRRELNDENRVILGQNPWGTFNPSMTVISFSEDTGRNVANIIHYGLHGTAAGANTEITRDWSGIMVDALEKQSGAITAFFNGPEGDVGPRLSNKKTVGDMSYVRELGFAAAKDAVQIFEKISDYRDVSLSVSYQTLQIPLKKRMALTEATRLLEQYQNNTVNYRGMIRAHLEQVIGSYENGFADKETFPMGQTLIGLGELVFAAFPYELFSEIGMRINGAIEGKTVLSLSNTNGNEGYFVTQSELCRGGYEVNMFLFGHLQPWQEDGDFHLMKQTVAHIKHMEGE